jgi:AcrR family transcriptional regulator
VAAIPVLDLQSLRERGDDSGIEVALAAGVEPGLVAQRGEQHLEPFPEGVVTEIVQAGLRDGAADDVVEFGHDEPLPENPCQYTDAIMNELSTPAAPRRRYHSPARRERAVATRERIVDAGARLVRGFSSWDWDELTFRAVAERAGVSERTVYRNFPSERQLHDAIMARLEDEAGISYEDVGLDNLADVTARVFASLRRFAIKDTIGTPRGPAFAGADARRHEALTRAIAARAPRLPDAQRRSVAGLLDVLWSPPTYERLIGAWDLDNAEAIGAVQWLIAKVIGAVDDNEGPTFNA